MNTVHPKRKGNRGIARKETSQSEWVKLIRLRNAGSIFQHEYLKLRNKIAEENYDLIVKLSELMHYKHPDFSKDDLQSFAASGLLDAINKYDPQTGNKFETFATYRLFGSMYDEMRKAAWTPRLVRQRQAITDLHREKFITQNGRSPTEEELVELLKKAGVEKAERVVRDSQPKGSISINGSSSDHEESKEVWVVSSTDDNKDISEAEDSIYQMVVSDIGSLAARVCSLIYARDMTEEEVANELEIEVDIVKKMHKKSLKTLRLSSKISQDKTSNNER